MFWVLVFRFVSRAVSGLVTLPDFAKLPSVSWISIAATLYSDLIPEIEGERTTGSGACEMMKPGLP